MDHNTEEGLKADIAAVSGISIVSLILEVICRTTGLGFSAVARVTPERWIACEVRDEINFGLRPGGELQVDTTICHEIRQTGNAVIIDHVANDEFYRLHHTPAMYGFQSYISIPVVRASGGFFGTLCAIDPEPAILNNPEIITMFRTYAALISYYLDAVEQLPSPKFGSIEDSCRTELHNFLKEIQDYNKNTPDRRSQQFLHIVRRSSDKMQELLQTLRAI